MTRVLAIALTVFLGLCLVLLIVAVIVVPRTRLQMLNSPDGSHRAELHRRDSIDRNYLVYLDDKCIFVSPDFRPSVTIPYRETLLWDRSGRILMLEVAKRRIFGYDVAAARRLNTAELLAAELSPDPPLWEYYYEGEWPGIGRVYRPDLKTAPSP